MKASQPADAIIVTFSKRMIDSHGGLLAFTRYFLRAMEDENTLWHHKAKNIPVQDIMHVYVSIAGRLAYRLNYAGVESGPVQLDGPAGKGLRTISWRRMILAGPVVRAPNKIKQKGFQGFRYTQTIF